MLKNERQYVNRVNKYRGVKYKCTRAFGFDLSKNFNLKNFNPEKETP